MFKIFPHGEKKIKIKANHKLVEMFATENWLISCLKKVLQIESKDWQPNITIGEKLRKNSSWENTNGF